LAAGKFDLLVDADAAHNFPKETTRNNLEAQANLATWKDFHIIQTIGQHKEVSTENQETLLHFEEAGAGS
jgi:hypothetical protein